MTSYIWRVLLVKDVDTYICVYDMCVCVYYHTRVTSCIGRRVFDATKVHMQRSSFTRSEARKDELYTLRSTRTTEVVYRIGA